MATILKGSQKHCLLSWQVWRGHSIVKGLYPVSMV